VRVHGRNPLSGKAVEWPWQGIAHPTGLLARSFVLPPRLRRRLCTTRVHVV